MTYIKEEKFGDYKKQTSMREDYTKLKIAFKRELNKLGEDYVDAFLNHLEGCAKHGYPNRSTITDYLTNEAHDETYYKRFLSALFKVYYEFLKQLKMQHSGKICDHMFDILISDRTDAKLFEL
ncbi:10004_t:CDS:2 [Funneliformis caledonium]|uniref:10004_t:CDS:1 n=1 Tax=Funneliformis caledonium TaxID=1117310 RepID=A0A9N9EC90_9GLOM|nr:10004_t:CDS:2 [Funneliformis caledonium]